MRGGSTYLLHMDGYVKEVQDLVHGTCCVDQALWWGHTKKSSHGDCEWQSVRVAARSQTDHDAY